MVRTQIYLPDDLYNDLKLLADSGEKNLSELIREGAKLVVAKKSRKFKKDAWKDFVGACKFKFNKSGTELINDYYENDVV